MRSSATNVNSYILNKYRWMSRQLRNFNDSNSIIQRSSAMLSVKNLLLHPQEADILLPTTLPAKSANTFSNTHHPFTISRQSSLCFLPAAEPYHTLSRAWNANFQPQPSPLSTFTTRELSILPHTPPDDSYNPPIKRRKTIFPPEVDCQASVDCNASTTILTDSNSSSLRPPTVTKTCTPSSKTKIYHDPPLPKPCQWCAERTKECFCRRYERMTPAQQKKLFGIT